jgi:hypothetical protein
MARVAWRPARLVRRAVDGRLFENRDARATEVNRKVVEGAGHHRHIPDWEREAKCRRAAAGKLKVSARSAAGASRSCGPIVAWASRSVSPMDRHHRRDARYHWQTHGRDARATWMHRQQLRDTLRAGAARTSHSAEIPITNCAGRATACPWSPPQPAPAARRRRSVPAVQPASPDSAAASHVIMRRSWAPSGRANS